jgi:predicted acyltransferase
MFYFWLDGPDTETQKIRGKWWQTPALVYRSNAILGFVIYSLVLALHLLYRMPSAHAPAYWLSGTTYAKLCQWIDPYNVSLLYGLAAVGLVMGLLWPLYKRKIFLKL